MLGLVGALLGYLIFTVGLGIGDTDIFDWGGVLSALIGTIIVLVIATLVFRRTSSRPSLCPLPWRQASGRDLSHIVIGGEYDSGKYSRW